MQDPVHRMKLMPSNLLYHNISTLRENVYSHAVMARARLGSDVKSRYRNVFAHPEPDIVSLKRGIESEALHDFVEMYEELIEDEDHADTTRFQGDVLRRSIKSTDIDIEDEIDSYGDIVPGWLRDEIRDYYGCEFRITGFKAYRHYPHRDAWKNETDYQSLFQWHQDPFPPSALKVFIPLTDFTEENGATRYLSIGDSQDSPLKQKLGWGDDPKELEKEHEVETLTGERFHPILFKPQNILHRAGEVSEGESRDLLTLFVVPHKDPSPENWADHELYNLENIFTSGMKQFKSV